MQKSGDTKNNSQVWPWSKKWSGAKANRVLSREPTGHRKHPLPTTQELTLYMDITDGQYQNHVDYILYSWRWRSSIQSAKARLGVDCGSDHEFLITKFRLKLKKVRKTTRPFRYNLNQILYDYTVEVTNRFKGWIQQTESLKSYGTGLQHCTGKQWPRASQREKYKRAEWLPEEPHK